MRASVPASGSAPTAREAYTLERHRQQLRMGAFSGPVEKAASRRPSTPKARGSTAPPPKGGRNVTKNVASGGPDSVARGGTVRMSTGVAHQGAAFGDGC